MYKVATNNNKEALFDEDGKQISNWFSKLYAKELINGKSNYYIARNGYKYAIFHLDNPDKSITK